MVQEFKDTLKSRLERIKIDSPGEYVNVVKPVGSSVLQNRTAFWYRLLENIANDMNLEMEKEFLHIDVSFKEKAKQYGWYGRKVFIEIENNIWGYPNKEIEKLCAVNAPLKVFITWIWNDWAKERDNFLIDAPEGNYPDALAGILNSHQEIFKSFSGDFLFIIAETTKDHIKFFSSHWNANDFSNGFFEDDAEILFECQLTS